MIRFVVIFLLIFGPKIGVIDTRLALIVYPLIFPPTFTRRLILVTLFPVGFLFYSIAIFVIFGNEDSYPDFYRYIRVVVSVLVTLSFIQVNPRHKIEKTLAMVLLVNAVISILSILSLDFESFIHHLIGYSKNHKAFRSTGFTMGYDINGLILLITGYYFYIVRRNRFISVAVFVVALFTSRVTIVISMMSLVIILFKEINRDAHLVKRALFIGIVAFGLYIFYQNIGSVILASMTLTDSSDLISTSYSRTTNHECDAQGT